MRQASPGDHLMCDEMNARCAHTDLRTGLGGAGKNLSLGFVRAENQLRT